MSSHAFLTDTKVHVIFATDTKPTIYQQQQYQFVKGDPVKLLCLVESNVIGWKFFWYRVVPYRDGLPEAPRWDGKARHSLELLSDSIRQAEGTYTLSSAAPEHSGLYVCGVQRGEPAYITYSSPTFVWIKGKTPVVAEFYYPHIRCCHLHWFHKIAKEMISLSFSVLFLPN